MSDPYLGEIRLFAFPKIPSGWAACNGQQLSVADNNALFALIGVTYGGNGTTTFGVPNLNGTIPIGQGTGTGLTARTMAQTGGTETVTLTAADTPPHTHSLQATTATATTTQIGATVTHAGITGEKHYVSSIPPSTKTFELAPNAITSISGDQAHNNIMPTMALNYCICTLGTWPQNPN